MEKLLSKIINEAAEQAKLFIGLDKISSTSIADEIINEKDISTKLSKLIRLLLDRLRFQQVDNTGYDEKLDKLLENLELIDSSTPDSKDKLFQWIPSKILQQRNNLKQMSKQIAKYEEKAALAEETMQNLGQQVSISQQKYREKIKKLQNDIENLQQNIANENQVHNQKIQETDKLINQLKQANSELEKKVFDLHVSINSLTKENSQLKQSIYSKPKLDADKEELIHQIERLQKRLKKAEKLQNMNIQGQKDYYKALSGKAQTPSPHIKKYNSSHKMHHSHKEDESTSLSPTLESSTSSFDFSDSGSESVCSALSSSSSYSSSKSSYSSARSYSSSKESSECERSHKKRSTHNQKHHNKPQHHKCCSCCKCKCHKIDLDSLRSKYGKLESDVEDLQQVLSAGLKN